jgi:alpha-beta hydrolase superfamily lysophospholipase
MQVPVHCTARKLRALAALLVLATAAVRTQPAPATPAVGESTLIVFLNGREVGREQVSLARTPQGWTIAASGSLGAPFNQSTKRFEVTYAPDWQPIELKIDAVVEARAIGLSTSFGTTTAINEVTNNGVTQSKTDQITARTVVLPNNFFAAYEALAARLFSMTPGGELAVYIAPQGEVKATIRAVTPSTYQAPAGPLNTRRFSVSLQSPTGPIDAEITVDERGRFARADIPSLGLSVARQDLAGVATRQQTIRNPTDSDVTVPAAGFGLAGTVTTPTAQGRLRHPGVVLVAGSGPVERDAVVSGIPLFAQLAGQLAERDFVVLRYDKRGTGQSGGRTERATLQDYADDAAAAVKWMAKRKDVDSDRIFVVGHSEGAAIAMLAAVREKKVKGLVTMAGMGIPGRDLILEQQQQVLEASKLSEADRAARVELQKRILEATVTEKGWETLPADVRRAVDTPWYRSLLTFDPAQTMARVKQPVLILQGELDSEVKPYHADRLADLGRARKKSGSTEVKRLPHLNHLFVVAKTGASAEYPVLQEKTISPDVASAIAAWVASVPR